MTQVNSLGNAHARLSEVDAALDGALAEIREGVVQREQDRQLPHEIIGRLQSLGLGRSRVPRELGGEEASLETVFNRLIRLAAADSNVAHAYRGHIAYVEELLLAPASEHRERWLGRIADGALIGNAQSERRETADTSTTIERDGERLTLTGTKYYTTGSIYADWIQLSAVLDDRHVSVIAPTAHAGTRSVDDWDGFGQQLTGSGTTTFTRVPIEEADIRDYEAGGTREAYLAGVFQLVLLAVVAGILEAAVADTVAFVRPRRRIFGFAGETLPREDPLVQAVVGGISSVAHTVRQVVLASARELGDANAAHRRGDDAHDAVVTAQLNVYRAQQVLLPLALQATSELFEVGGASAVGRGFALDRHWRNVRTVASHNPAVQRRRALGDYVLNGRVPTWGGADKGERQDAAAPTAAPEEIVSVAPPAPRVG